MAARGYEFYLRVLKVSVTSERSEKIISSPRAVKILFLSFTCEDIGVAMVTTIITQLQ